MRFRKELVGSATCPLILAVLNNGPAHGYEIVQTVNMLSGGHFEWREGTVYPALHRLEKQGLIRGDWRRSDAGKRRRVYSLTAAGRKELAAQRQEWGVFAESVSRIMEKCHA